MQTYLEVSEQAGRLFMMRSIVGPVIMMNLLRFREQADYSTHPNLAPPAPISGREAFRRYFDHTLPFLEASGGKVRLLAQAGPWLIGPEAETWDMAMAIEQSSVEAFIAWNGNEEYLRGIGHRSAALSDSRILPLAEQSNF